MHYHVETPISHAQWRQLVKKEQRRRHRQKLARQRDEGMLAAIQDSNYQKQLLAEQTALQHQKEIEQLRHQQLKIEWQARDLALHSLFLHNKDIKEERERKEQEQQELIQKEWQCKQKEEEEAKKSKETCLKSQALLQLAQGALLQGGGESSTNPEPPSAVQAPAHQVCSFFTKTGACRFGNRCSRSHVYPPVSRTLLLPNMYVALGALPGADCDSALEHDDTDRRDHFSDFFKDLCSEASKHGGLLEVRVCCNTVHHLHGNVYLRYERTSDAVAAAAALHGRYYAGRVVTCLFVPVENFRSAICGLYWRNLCPKGGGCNFLHPHSNPGNAYTGVPHHGASGRHRNGGSSRSSQRSSGSYSRRSRSKSPRSSRSYKRSKSPPSARTSNRTKSVSLDKSLTRGPASDRSDRRRKHGSSSRSSYSRSSRSRSRSPRPSKRKHSKTDSKKRDRKRSSSPSPYGNKRTPTVSYGKEASPRKSRRKRNDSFSPSREQSNLFSSTSADNQTRTSIPPSTNNEAPPSPPPSSSTNNKTDGSPPSTNKSQTSYSPSFST